MMNDLRLSTLISEADIQRRVSEIGRDISSKFKNETLIVVGVLKGAFIFYSDLIRVIDCDLYCDFFGVSSYSSETISSGEVKLTLDLSSPIENKHVLLVEDIVDTGLTMNYLQQLLLNRKPKSLTSVALLHKPDSEHIHCHLDYIGFTIPNDFVIGYGLDYQNNYRNLPYIARVENIN